jgi:hypothetical protein
MRTIDATALSGFACKTAESASDFVSVVRDLIKDVRHSYRPQLRYERDPRPKWRAKYQPWPRFDAEAVPTRGRDQPVDVRRRDAAKLTP